ncbi:unnamed protein product [Mytilus edulis]|uniref:Uncharacterized protein n=1 Tax=Mytilus edulis TaxID=6550 RepID=A0A8S3VBL8_MYTED|nr:unnamed protein product [Mytilus edulis]
MQVHNSEKPYVQERRKARKHRKCKVCSQTVRQSKYKEHLIKHSKPKVRAVKKPMIHTYVNPKCTYPVEMPHTANKEKNVNIFSMELFQKCNSGGRSRCSVSRSTPGAAVPMVRGTPVGIPADRDAHSAPPLGRGFQGRKETTQERKRRRNRQKERQAEETARLQRALRDAQQRRTPQSGARDRAGVSEKNSFQGGGRRDTGVQG